MENIELANKGKNNNNNNNDPKKLIDEENNNNRNNRNNNNNNNNNSNNNDDSLINKIRKGRLAAYYKKTRTSPQYFFFITLITLYAVYIEDISIICFPTSADYAVNVVYFFCFSIFASDLILSSLIEKGYFLSIVFFLDIIATASMGFRPLIIDGSGSYTESQGLVLARIARLMRIVRIMRVAQFSRITTTTALSQAEKGKYNSIKNAAAASHPFLQQSSLSSFVFSSMKDFDKQQQQQPLPAIQEKAKQQQQQQQQNRDSKKIQFHETINKISNSLKISKSSNNNNNHNTTSSTTGSDSDYFHGRTTIGSTLMENTSEKVILLVLLLVVSLQVVDISVSDLTASSNLAILDSSFAYYDNNGCFNSSRTQQIFDYNTCHITSCCDDWKIAISRFSNNLELNGLYPVIKKLVVQEKTFLDHEINVFRSSELNKISYNKSSAMIDITPLIIQDAYWSLALTTLIILILLVFPYLFGRDVLALVVLPLELIYERVQSIAENPLARIQTSDIKQQSKSFELDMIKESLTRLTKLLQVGLGQAGTNIIVKNLSHGSFSALQPGEKMDIIIGFCGIRNFSPCSEVLQEDTVIFINTIASALTDSVVESRGVVNKNIGECFLLVWKWLNENEKNNKTMVEMLAKSPYFAAELSLRAAVKIVRKIRRSDAVQSFAQRPEIVQRLGSDFIISVGFGLHLGWAIEGAVGSEMKIDATYLSPNVNLAARIESATKQYGTHVLVSHHFAKYLSEITKARCRPIDCVAVKGSAEPITLITYEMGKNAKQTVIEAKVYYKLYIDGKWDECKIELENFMEKHPRDGPGKTVLEYLKSKNFIAPEDWKGYRKLESK